MCGIIGSVVILCVGAILVVVSCLVTFIAIPSLIENFVINSVVLLEDTIQMERFEDVPFYLNFSVTIFNISNPNEVLNGGVAAVDESGPYVYRLYQGRNVSGLEDDLITYRKTEYFEFDAEASYPYTEDDIVTIINVPYHAIIQIAERNFPELMSVLPLAMNGIFGQYNNPIMNVRAGDLVIDKIPMCTRPGIIGTIACAAIREMASTADNIEVQDDGSVTFSILANKHNVASPKYEVYRGLTEPRNLGIIRHFDGLPYFNYWTDEEGEDGEVIKSRCNDINGTDSGIFPPLLNRNNNLYAINTDICRSVELRFQGEVEFEDIPAYRYSANEWFLDNDDGCFCLNTTAGITQENGCLFKGAMELYSCVGKCHLYCIILLFCFGTASPLSICCIDRLQCSGNVLLLFI
ncbi:hypothetical protein O3G_MSEX010917 [Manduca sexta]|uniref:Sensory neuron membrane protein 2 n=1 Tax=Manduca sexta TaxID=7130 RepID=A0A921ZIV5_MANSE|nr:hypothetical protein O3G_MSEX010917 [Manduca sexta]